MSPVDDFPLVCPTEEGGEAGKLPMADIVLMARFAFKGRDPEDVVSLDATEGLIFRAAVDREPEGVGAMDGFSNMAFRLRMGREAEGTRLLGGGVAMAFRFAMGR